jgi:recombination protein RecT
MVPEIQRAVPKHLDGDRIARLALTALRKDPKLAQCSEQSFAGALLTAAALGLEIGVNDEAYLAPYKGEATLIVGYKGYAKLFYQHPLAQYLTAEVVYANDEFEYAKGLDPYLTHKPAKGDRGEIVAYYAAARLTTGAKDFVVLTPEECKKLRGGKVGSNAGIPDPMHWMERKTAVRQLVKLLPKSTSLARAVESDEIVGSALYRQQLAENSEPVQAVSERADGWPPVAEIPGADQ